MIDEIHHDWHEAGLALLSEAHSLARVAGAVQGIEVCGHLDEAKRNFLCSEGFSIASEWFVKTL
jgi:hypothetical protein